MKIAVHDGVFHADDVFAVAALKLLHPDSEIIRTRDEAILKTADMRIDVGQKNDPSTGDFDHHMREGAGKRENGIPYAAFGLVWKHFGTKITGTPEAAEHIERKIVAPVDAHDNGVKVYETKEETSPYTVSKMIESMNPGWQDEPKDYDGWFHKMVDVAIMILKKEIARTKGFKEACELVKKKIAESEDKRYIILDKYVPWQEEAQHHEELLYIIFPSPTGEWRIRAVPEEKGGFTHKKQLPAAWGGLNGQELAQVSGISDAIFCHKGLWLAGAKSFESIKKMLALALE